MGPRFGYRTLMAKSCCRRSRGPNEVKILTPDSGNLQAYSLRRVSISIKCSQVHCNILVLETSLVVWPFASHVSINCSCMGNKLVHSFVCYTTLLPWLINMIVQGFCSIDQTAHTSSLGISRKSILSNIHFLQCAVLVLSNQKQDGGNTWVEGYCTSMAFLRLDIRV